MIESGQKNVRLVPLFHFRPSEEVVPTIFVHGKPVAPNVVLEFRVAPTLIDHDVVGLP